MGSANEQPAPDPLEMSDEEFVQLGDEQILAMTGPGEAEDEDDGGEADPAGGSEATGAEDEDSDDDDEDSADADSDDDIETAAAGDDDPAEPAAADDADDSAAAEPAGADDGVADGSDAADDGTAGEDRPPAIDHKTFFEKVTAPFRANGRDMQVDNVEDVIRLMQMGANYNRKMASMKPHLKLLKTLEKNGISEEKLGFLIDLDQKNPAAIARLLKDGNIDPLAFDADQDQGYQAPKYTVDDRELALDTVIEEIKDSPTYTRTLDIVSTSWDADSKQIVADTPELLRVINDHVANGIYDAISTRVEQERMLGRLNGLSDIEAYRRVGDAIHAQGGFDHLSNQGQGQQDQPEPEAPARKTEEASKRRDKRRAASPTKGAAPADRARDFNPLALSDEDYLQQFDAKFL
jgi:hypothetical protein